MEMSGRDCVLAALNHEEPERLPVDFGGRHTTLHINAHRNLKKYLGIENPSETFRQFWLQTIEIDSAVQKALGGDVAAFCTSPPANWELSIDKNETFFDEWGAGYRMPEGSSYYDYYYHPLAKVKSITELEDYSWPDPLDPGRYEGLAEVVKSAYDRGDQAIMQTIAPAGSWEHTWTLRGPEQALIDLMLNRDLYEEILERTVQFQIAQWRETLQLVGEWVDIAAFSDDLGTQTGPLMSPALYREIFKPRLARVIAEIKKWTRAKIYIHTDGSVYDFLDDLIEVGIDIINPVQKECHKMNLANLKKDYGDKLVFWGAAVETRNLEHNTPDQIREEARQSIQTLAPGGGYVYGPIHNIQPFVPPENIVALTQAAKDFGRYPIEVCGP
jgi:uroporphyrinogen decarboxylase